jgi:hypothetical protein
VHDGRQGIGQVALFQRILQIDAFNAARRRCRLFSHEYLLAGSRLRFNSLRRRKGPGAADFQRKSVVVWARVLAATAGAEAHGSSSRLSFAGKAEIIGVSVAGASRAASALSLGE